MDLLIPHTMLQVNVTTDEDLGTIYSVAVPVKRVKPTARLGMDEEMEVQIQHCMASSHKQNADAGLALVTSSATEQSMSNSIKLERQLLNAGPRECGVGRGSPRCR